MMWKYAVTTQAHEGIETSVVEKEKALREVTTQAHEGIETISSPDFWENQSNVTTQAHEGIETIACNVRWKGWT